MHDFGFSLSIRYPRCRMAISALSVWMTLGFYPGSVAADEASIHKTPPGIQCKLGLMNDDYLTGELLDSDLQGSLRLQSPLFKSPFQFPADRVRHLAILQAQVSIPEVSEMSFELDGGDLLLGKLVGLNTQEIEVETRGLGKLHIALSRLRRIASGVLSSDGKHLPELIYLGPKGLENWNQVSEKGARSDGDSIVLGKPGSVIAADINLPLKGIIECKLAWKSGTQFLMSLGVGATESSAKSAFGIEVWENDLVARRETESDADVASIATMKPEDGSIHLLIFLNRIEGRMQVFSTAGEKLADLQVKNANPGLETGVRLALKKGELRLEQLRVSNWSGEHIPTEAWGKSRIHKTDGSLVLGAPTGFDPTQKELIVQESGKESRVKLDQVANLFLPSPDSGPATGLRVQLKDGTRMSGEFLSIQKGRVLLRSSGIQEQIQVPLGSLVSLTSLAYLERRPEPKGNGKLIADGLTLQGAFENSEPGSSLDSGPLIWQPDMAVDAIPILPDASGKIIFRRVARTTSDHHSGKQSGSNSKKQDTSSSSTSLPAVSGQRTSLHLVSGDSLPCRVKTIDDRGVHFESSMTEAGFVSHEFIKAIELSLPESLKSSAPIPNNFPPGVRIQLARPREAAPEKTVIDSKKQERLLTVPRMQKSNPPTHLICARNGDILRGRIVSLNEALLKVELRLEVREIQRDRIARIIWLHPEKLTEKKQESPAGTTPDEGVSEAEVPGIRVHLVQNNGIRLTFHAQRLESNRLSGRSEVLGGCEVSLQDVGQLFLGEAIEESAIQSAYQQWKLQAAIEPLAPPAEEGDGEGSLRSGKESPLVGKSVPDVSLKMRGGGEFQLESKRGKILVVDFWASWCGPCRRTLPQVQTVSKEFESRGVELITINLEESEKQISAALSRLGLDLPVAMDLDGGVGARFGITTIPTTMILDREGKISYVFIGGNNGFDQEIRGAIQELLNDPSRPKNVSSPQPE